MGLHNARNNAFIGRHHLNYYCAVLAMLRSDLEQLFELVLPFRFQKIGLPGNHSLFLALPRF